MTLCIDEGVTSKLQAVIAQLFSSLQLFALRKQKKKEDFFNVIQLFLCGHWAAHGD